MLQLLKVEKYIIEKNLTECMISERNFIVLDLDRFRIGQHLKDYLSVGLQPGQKSVHLFALSSFLVSLCILNELGGCF